MRLMATLDGTYMCEFAVGRFAGVALIPPTNRLALELVSPVLGQGIGLWLLCLLPSLVFCLLLFPRLFLPELAPFAFPFPFALDQLFQGWREFGLCWSPLEEAGDIASDRGHFHSRLHPGANHPEGDRLWYSIFYGRLPGAREW